MAWNAAEWIILEHFRQAVNTGRSVHWARGGGSSELKMGGANETFTQQNITWDLTRSRKSFLSPPPEMSHEGYYENDISVRWRLPKDSAISVAAFVTTTSWVCGNIACVFANPWTSWLGDTSSCLIQTGMILWTIYVGWAAHYFSMLGFGNAEWQFVPNPIFFFGFFFQFFFFLPN